MNVTKCTLCEHENKVHEFVVHENSAGIYTHRVRCFSIDHYDNIYCDCNGGMAPAIFKKTMVRVKKE